MITKLYTFVKFYIMFVIEIYMEYYKIQDAIDSLSQDKNVTVFTTDKKVIAIYDNKNKSLGTLIDFRLYKNYLQSNDDKYLYEIEHSLEFLNYCFENDKIFIISEIEINYESNNVNIFLKFKKYDTNNFEPTKEYFIKTICFNFKENETYVDEELFETYGRQLCIPIEQEEENLTEYIKTRLYDDFIREQIMNIPSSICVIVYNLILNKFFKIGYNVENMKLKKNDLNFDYITKNNTELKLKAFLSYKTIKDVYKFFAYKSYTIKNENEYSKEELLFFKTNPTPKDILKFFHISNLRCYRKLILNRLDYLKIIKNLGTYGFSPNYIYFLIKNEIITHSDFNVKNIDIIEELMRIFSVKEVYRKLLIKDRNEFRNISGTIKDINSMIYQLSNNDMSFSLTKINLSQNIKNIEEQLSDIHFEVFTIPEEIKYSVYTDSFIYEDSRYKLYLPNNTKDIKRAGKNMHICVGAYTNDVLKGKRNVMLLFDKRKRRHIGCFELDCMFKTVIQAKGICNKKLSEEIQQLFINFCRTNNIKILTKDININLCA